MLSAPEDGIPANYYHNAKPLQARILYCGRVAADSHVGAAVNAGQQRGEHVFGFGAIFHATTRATSAHTLLLGTRYTLQCRRMGAHVVMTFCRRHDVKHGDISPCHMIAYKANSPNISAFLQKVRRRATRQPQHAVVQRHGRRARREPMIDMTPTR